MSTRVLWLAKGLGFGGAERLLVSAATYLDRDAYAPEVAYVLPWKDGLVPELVAAGIPTRCLGRGQARASWVGPLARLLRSGRYDLVHTHSPVTAAAARVLAPAALPIVHTEHNVWPRYRRPTRWANALTFARNDAVIAVSEGVAGSISPPSWTRGPGRWTPPPVEVLIHGIDPARVVTVGEGRDEARRALGIPSAARVIGTVANMTPKKDQRTLLDAVARLTRDVDDVVLVIVGTGPLQDDLTRHAAHLGIADRVRFLGIRDDVPTILPAFDVFALTSLHEGLSIALVEALASEVPAVATAVGGVPEVVTDGQEGFLVAPRQADEIATALRKLLTDPDLRDRMGRAGAVRAADFHIDRAVRAMEAVYDRVLTAP